jgi:hypothetical protein
MNSLDHFVKFIPNSSVINSGSLSTTSQSNMELKAKKFTLNLNDALYENANEPSIGCYRIQVIK